MAQHVVDVVAHVRDALHGSEIADIRALQVEFDDGQVVLRGIVSSFYYKQLAQELVRRFVHGLQMENAVSVRSWDEKRNWCDGESL